MFDREALIAACLAQGHVVRVVVTAVHGSAPREVGAAMCVWEGGQSGTIGGGALEYELTEQARHLTQDTRTRHALGPDLGQCCGGAVEVLSEVYDLPRARALPRDAIARGPEPMPMPVKRLLKAARNQGITPCAQLHDGWMVEPVRPPDRDIWIWGAGHVGRALVDMLHKVPGHQLTWVDTGADRFPDTVPDGVTCVPAADPVALAPHAPEDADHLILTYSHNLDLGLCHALLARGLRSCGLIGSATKWARFRKRLAALGHSDAEIARITCPIGDPRLGKQPHMIAIGVTYRLALSAQTIHQATGDPCVTSLLALHGLTKTYPGVLANDDVTLDIAPGEIHALLGENGAGKSTLVKMVYGLVKPDTGQMQMHGAEFAPADPRAARNAGVGMVFQHFSLFDALSVAENIALGMETPPPMRTLAARIREVSETYGLPLSPDRTVGDLSAGERQRVEIIRCLLQDPKLLIMDEPTSVLTPQEVDILFQTLRKLSAEGTAILYISHKLEEIRALCDAATILRGGKVVGGCVPRDTSARDMAEMMVGSTLTTPKAAAQGTGDVKLAVKELSAASPSAFGMALKDISFEVRAGEVLGIGGVAGNGQDELLAVVSGELPCAPGAVSFQGHDLCGAGPQARRGLGVLSAPEERLGHAAAPNMSLTENAMLTGAAREELVSRGILDWGKTRDFAQRIIKGFDVRTPGPENVARALSGGNLQKFVIGREVLQRPEVLVVNQPTWGVDAAAAAAIRQALLDLAAEGTAVVVISQDLDELMEISDRFAALNEGRLSPPRPTQGLDVEQIGLMLGGAHGIEVAHV